MSKQVQIIVEPDNKRGVFPKGTTLYKALYTLGISMNASCGGFGKCGKCLVKVLKNAPPPRESDKMFISSNMLKEGFRLACQTKLMKDMRVFVPPETKRHISQTIYGKGKRVNEIICIEEGDTTSMSYGIAVDIGTATITALLVDLLTENIISRAFSVNPQAAFGEDVISRIANALNRYGLRNLQTSVRGGINLVLNELIGTSGIERKYIYEVVFVGNTGMHHLFLGIPPNSLAVSPYIPLVRESLYIKATDIGIDFPSYTRCYIFPNIAGFVGGDTVGAVMSSGMLRSKKTKLLIDIGTNGEIVLSSKERVCAVSCAAGPAFEGVRLSCGMPASKGAIEGVDIEGGNIRLKVIGGEGPKGICGSGIIDLLAQLLRMGIIDKTGRLKRNDKIIPTKEGLVFPLTEYIYISQGDIRQLQLAKAALRAGIEILKKYMKIKDKDIDEVLIAGAFGNFLRRESLTKIGIIPKVLLEKVHFIGNAAIEGARLALLSKKIRREAENISKRVEYLELMGRVDFQEEFLNAMGF